VLLIVPTALALGVVIYFLADKPYLQAVVTAGLLITSIVIFILTTRQQQARDLLSDRRQHSKDLYEVYKRLMHVYIREERDGSYAFKVPVHYEDSFNYDMMMRGQEPDLISVDRIENFDWAMEHLKEKKYEELHKAWSKLDECRIQNSELSDLVPILKEVADDKVSAAFPSFVNLEDVGVQHDGDFYSIHHICTTIKKHFDFIIEGDGKVVVVKEPYGSRGNHRVQLYGNTIFSSQNSDLLNVEQIQEVIRSIVKDSKITTALEENTDFIRKELDARKQFESKLEHLLKKLKGGYVIEGKCELGY
jgi:hypothetical protein